MLKVEIGAEAEICNMSAVRLPPPLMCRADHDGGGELAKKTKIESGEPSLPALTSVPDSALDHQHQELHPRFTDYILILLHDITRPLFVLRPWNQPILEIGY